MSVGKRDYDEIQCEWAASEARWLTDVLAERELRVLLARDHTEGVCTEVVALWTGRMSQGWTGARLEGAHLRLEDVRGDDLAAVAVEERERSAESRSGDAPESRLGNDASPSWLGVVDGW